MPSSILLLPSYTGVEVHQTDGADVAAAPPAANAASASTPSSSSSWFSYFWGSSNVDSTKDARKDKKKVVPKGLTLNLDPTGRLWLSDPAQVWNLGAT